MSSDEHSHAIQFTAATTILALERASGGLRYPVHVADIRQLLADFNARTVARYFVRAEFNLNPDRHPDDIKSQYGLED
jgi:hypothetical protein